MIKWVERELNRLLTGNEDEDKMQKVMNSNILDIIKVFVNQGHSGCSANYMISILTRLLDWKPITPLIGNDDEWNEVGQGVYQNRRCPTIFKNDKNNSMAYNGEGKVFSDDDGETWYTNIDSRIPVTFPYLVPSQPEFIILTTKEEK